MRYNDGLTLPYADYGISIITEIELFSYSKLTELEKNNIERLLSHFKIFNINDEIKKMTIEIRKNYGVKLPDSIISATALVNGLALITNDKQLSKIDDLDILSLEEFL